MAEQYIPPWLEGRRDAAVVLATAPAPTPRTGQFQKGESGNPKGRPRGIVDARSRITKALMDDAAAIAKVVVAQALEGDLSAASLVLARCAPSIRSEARPVQFEFDASGSMAEQIAAVLVAISNGSVPVDLGRQVIDAIGTLSDAKAVEDLESRIANLEAKEKM